ncbi:VCBS repeat-containing protein [Parafrankia sp. FMc6]|uniref:VCBS repeat-containing protein n=1 Tax=Parafrankia soli TaxID=2599596 RepID=UPI0034D48817
MSSGLEPEELTRLLRAAVEPVRASPDALHRIRAGVERRRWWRLPLMATGGVAMAALIILAIVAVRPKSSNQQVVEPAAPPLVSSVLSETSRPATPSTGGSGGSNGGNGVPGSTRPPRATSSPSAAATTPPSTVSPSSPPASSTPGPGGSGAADLPTPVTRPAGANDVDGDGIGDPVRVNETTSKIEVTLSRSGRTTSVDLPGLQLPTVHAVVDANVDGFAEILVRTATRDGIEEYTMLRYAARDVLAPVTLGPGVRLSAGQRDNAGFGFGCDETGMRLVAGTSSTVGTDFQVVTTPLQLTLEGLVTAGQGTTTQMPASGANSQFRASCGVFS